MRQKVWRCGQVCPIQINNNKIYINDIIIAEDTLDNRKKTSAHTYSFRLFEVWSGEGGWLAASIFRGEYMICLTPSILFLIL